MSCSVHMDCSMLSFVTFFTSVLTNSVSIAPFPAVNTILAPIISQATSFCAAKWTQRVIYRSP